MVRRIILSISVNKSTVERVDRERGKIPRSVFIEDIILEWFKKKGGEK